MFYSSSDDEEDIGLKVAAESSSSYQTQPSYNTFSKVDPYDSPKVVRPTSAAQSPRIAAQARARALEEKRRANRSNIPGMVTEAGNMPRPSSALGSPRVNNFTSAGDADIKVLLKERNALPEDYVIEQKGMSDAERTLMSQGISSTFDPREEEEDVVPPSSSTATENIFQKRSTETAVPPEREELQSSSELPSPPASPKVSSHAPKSIINVDASDVRAFINQCVADVFHSSNEFRPGPKGGFINCKIIRSKSAFGAEYYLYLEEGERFLLAARKRKKSKTSNYLISLERGDLNRNSGNFVGKVNIDVTYQKVTCKVRSNFTGTEFVIYDRGVAPGKDNSNVGTRQELGAILYQSNVLGIKGPRKMKVIVPSFNPETDQRVQWKPTRPADSLLEKYKANLTEDMLLLQNKSPGWNEEKKSYMLNFYGRVKMASIKNFQIVSEAEGGGDQILMQFGRWNNEQFSLDFQYPLSLIQAFGIALASFDNKLACGLPRKIMADLQSCPSVSFPQGHHNCEDFLRFVVGFLTAHHQLLSGPVVHYLSKNLYEEIIPVQIRMWWDALDEPEWDHLLRHLSKGEQRDEYPSELRQFLEDLQSTQLSRDTPEFLKRTHYKLSDDLCIGQSPKKLHEVGRLCQLLCQVKELTNARLAIDAGSGQGYLSRSITFPPLSLSCQAIERSETNVASAKKTDKNINKRKTVKAARAEKDRNDFGLLVHTVADLDRHSLSKIFDKAGTYPETGNIEGELKLSPEEMREDNGGTIRGEGMERPKGEKENRQGKETEENREGVKKENREGMDQRGTVAVALHACGDLTTNCIRAFLDSSEHMCAAVFIPCCYQLMCVEDRPDQWPLSHQLREIIKSNPQRPCRMGQSTSQTVTFEATYRLFMLANQVPSTWTLNEQEWSDFRNSIHHHYYRARIEKELLSPAIEAGIRPAETFKRMGRLPSTAFSGGFSEYKSAVIRKYKLEDFVSTASLEPEMEEDMMAEKRIALLWTLRALIAPAVESLIAIDRYLNMRESLNDEWDVKLLAAFEYTESQRNLCLVAYRRCQI
ncbi:tubby protein [Planoprotostelium fungivorum]|uniref:Tubby protein n=1 Tax=Planoprotostelium fungivorum TaxID=1890364 RepID=A0A2P6MXU3_9EUKA|nr:tubby protein [Planoprotostelium fungivorum]